MGSSAQNDLSFNRSQASDYEAERALSIHNPWADQILDGTKWEIRGSATGVRRHPKIASRCGVCAFCWFVLRGDPKAKLTAPLLPPRAA